jgi:NAD+ diphosphatase
MIQDIYPHEFENKFIETTDIQENDYIFYFNDNSLLLRKSDEGLEIPRKKELEVNEAQGIFLFSLNHTHCFLIWDCQLPEDDSFIYQEISFFRTIPQKEIAWASIVGYQMMNWFVHNKFCGKCGSPTTLKKEERAITCPSCQTTVYPKISPAIIVAILCKNRILLAQGINFRSRFYSLVAGYADIGESLEDTVAREVKEEVGLDVHNIRYYASQPWPFSGSMMIGYIAEADDTQPIRIDEKEISAAAWFTRGNLPNHPATISIAGEIIEKFEKGELG